MRIVAAALCLYVLGFLLFVPRDLSIADETAYVGQAVAFAHGQALVATKDPLTGKMTRDVPVMGYPIGTSLMQVPFVWLGGWRAAPLASVLSLVVMVWMLARWLARAGRSPLYALIALGYFPSLVLGRTGMSDLPSALVATIGLYLFFNREPASIWWGAVVGFVAGASTMMRETNALVFAAFFLGAAVRRERRVVGLVLGGLIGVALRPASISLLFGEAPRALRSHMAWKLDFFLHNAPLSLLSLLVFVPAGLLAAAAYRGPRRPEVIATLWGFFLFFTSYEYGAFESGGLKRMVLAPRYFLPVVPLFVIAIADVAPRWYIWLQRRVTGLRAGAKVAAGVWVAGVCIAAFAIHPAMSFRERGQREMIDVIYGTTGADALVITNVAGTRKLMTRIYGDRVTLDRTEVQTGDLARLKALHGSMQIVLLDRNDSGFFRNQADDNQQFIDRVRSRCEIALVHDRAHSGSDRLRIWNVLRCPTS
jgi:hypothetical protein